MEFLALVKGVGANQAERCNGGALPEDAQHVNGRDGVAVEDITLERDEISE